MPLPLSCFNIALNFHPPPPHFPSPHLPSPSNHHHGTHLKALLSLPFVLSKHSCHSFPSFTENTSRRHHVLSPSLAYRACSIPCNRWHRNRVQVGRGRPRYSLLRWSLRRSRLAESNSSAKTVSGTGLRICILVGLFFCQGSDRSAWRATSAAAHLSIPRAATS